MSNDNRRKVSLSAEEINIIMHKRKKRKKAFIRRKKIVNWLGDLKRRMEPVTQRIEGLILIIAGVLGYIFLCHGPGNGEVKFSCLVVVGLGIYFLVTKHNLIANYE